MSVPGSSAGLAVSELPVSDLLGLLRQMHEIRFFEDRVHAIYGEGLIRGSTHLCTGQEAVCVGACSALSADDTFTCTYRGHGALLARGAPLDACFGEILGREHGLCRGKGGSMHLADLSRGALGSFAIVGANLPVTVGAAFAARYRRDGTISLAFFGDGATNIGSFHESLNLASVWKLPAVFVCENNLYGEYSPVQTTTAITRLAGRAASYGIPGVTVDGNDVAEVHQAVAAAASMARAGHGPSLIEALTYRHHGHSRSDPAKYRPAGELEEWLARDPIDLLRTRLLGDGVSAAELDQLRDAARAVVDEAARTALAWAAPPVGQLLEDVWAR
jgi:acetoin:2,6-dichlorophenolindophenol oxidoreductase subunit alpha